MKLVDKVVRLVVDWKRKGSRVFVNATPGYRAETSFLVLASLLRASMLFIYMYEAFKDLVILPVILIEIKEGIKNIVQIFRVHRDPMEAEQILGSPERLRNLEL